MKRFLPIFFLWILLCSCELTPIARGRVYHIGIALSYQGSGVQPLRAPLNDLCCLTSALDGWYTENSVAHTLLSDDPSIPIDARATKEATVAALVQHAALATSEDLLFISYSGHGLSDGSWVLASPNAEIPIYTKEGGVDPAVLLSTEELYTLLQGVEAATLIVADCCYSGALIGPTQPNEITQRIKAAYRRYFQEEGYWPQIFVLTSTTEDHICSEPIAGVHTHGYFTEALLRSLGWDCTKQMIGRYTAIRGIDDLYQAIVLNQRIPIHSGSSAVYQCPTIGGGPVELLFNR